MIVLVPTVVFSLKCVPQTSCISDLSSPGPGCLKLTTSLVNVVSLNFQKLIPQICQYVLLKKCEKLLLLSFFQQKFQCIWL